MVITCASVQLAPQTYKFNFLNESGRVVHVAVTTLDPVERLFEECMLGVGENCSMDLEAGHYHIYASSSCGYFQKCVVIPRDLLYPNEPSNVHIICRKKGREA
jgi:hypothetical protein